MNDEPIRTIIVDDEALGRRAVHAMLDRDARFDVIVESSGGSDAIRQVRALQPDLLFLDIQMPEVDGFDVLENLGEDAPIVVMVTAFDQHAVRAFECHALDYVLKPIDSERFEKALDRVIQRVHERRAGQRNEGLMSLLDDLDSSKPRADRIVLKASGTFLCLRPNELDWVESAGNYVKLHVGEQVYLMRETVTEMSRRLDPTRFVRIHRSCIVNLDEVRELRTDSPSGECVAILRSGTELAVGRSNRKDLVARLEGR